MRSDYLPDDLKRLWKELEVRPVDVPPEDLRRESRRLGSGVRFRNGFVLLVCPVIIVVYGMFAMLSKTALERVGCVLSIAGAANVMIQFLRRPSRKMPDRGAVESVRFYRAELERHRDFHRGKGVLSWLLPLLPGPILFNTAFALDRPAMAPVVEFQMVAFLLIAALVVVLNLRMARRYQRRIDALASREQ